MGILATALTGILWSAWQRSLEDAGGAALARWRYLARFERQHAELMACLEERLTASTEAEVLAAGDGCLALAERVSERPPIAICVLVPGGEGGARWRSVRPLDSSVVAGLEHGSELGQGVNVVALGLPPGQGLALVRTLPPLPDRPALARGYMIVVRMADLR